ncbi:hypothetical protein PENSPDRAFT_755885 [Peniophora sp. CONT]|nr:hypothetical protein PENSPDRAFT_755885 [Peniophora sp. CONT]
MHVVSPIEDAEDAAPFDPSLTLIQARPSHVSFKPICRSLSRYGSQLELLSALRDVLKIHRHLSQTGLVHGDICPGTVLLSKGLSDAGKTTGILIDWDAVRSVPTATKDARQDLTIVSTAQFMAIDILQVHHATWRGSIKHNANHDIESMIYILAYTLLRHHLEDKATPQAVRTRLQTIIDGAFSHVSLEKVLTSRTRLDEDHPIAWMSHLYRVIVERDRMIQEGRVDVYEDPNEAAVAYWFLETIELPVVVLFGGLTECWRSPTDYPENLAREMNASKYEGMKRRRERYKNSDKDQSQGSTSRSSTSRPPLITYDRFLDLLDTAIGDLTC